MVPYSTYSCSIIYLKYTSKWHWQLFRPLSLCSNVYQPLYRCTYVHICICMYIYIYIYIIIHCTHYFMEIPWSKGSASPQEGLRRIPQLTSQVKPAPGVHPDAFREDHVSTAEFHFQRPATLYVYVYIYTYMICYIYIYTHVYIYIFYMIFDISYY